MTSFNRTVDLMHLREIKLDSDMSFLPSAIAQGVQLAGQRLDANESMVFALQLQHLRNEVMMRPYPQYKAKNLLPMQSEASPGAEEYAYIVADRVGMFKMITNYADDLPVTEVQGEKIVADIREFGGAVHYSIHDQERAAQSGMPLVQRKMIANRDVAEQKFDRIAWVGDAESGLFGIASHPNITATTVVAGAATTTPWPTKTAAEIYTDLVRPFIDQATATNGIERPDTIVMTAARFELLRTRFFGDNTGESVLVRFREAYPEVTIETVEWMATAGAGGTQAALYYRNDAQKVAVETPLPYMVMPPEQRNLATIVNARMRTAGAIVYFPLSVTRLQGI